MKFKDIFVGGIPSTGVAMLDVEKAIKAWDIGYRIIKSIDYKSNEATYRILSCSPKFRKYAKVTISKNDALEVIRKLNLQEVRHEIFKLQSTFLVV